MAQQAVDKPTYSAKTSQYGFVALAFGLALYIWWVRSDPNPPPTRPMPEMTKGATIDAPITLVTADRSDLACMLSNEVEGFHCEFAASDKTWAETHASDQNATDRKKLLAPYKTIDDVLLLVAGLFEDPAVDERYKDEPPKQAREKLQRFTAQCKVKLVTEAENVMVRWNPKGPWQGPHKVWIGTASNCQVSEP